MPTLQVIVHEAWGLPKKSGLLDKTDPFVEIQIGAATGRTNTANNAGERAAWNQVLTFPYNNDPTMLVHVKDDDGSAKKHDLLASGQVVLADVLGQGHWSGTLHLQPKAGLERKCKDPSVNLSVQLME